MTEKQSKNNIGTWIIFGFIIGAGVGVVLFPDKMAVGAGIGMCVGIFLAAMTQILTRNKQETD